MGDRHLYKNRETKEIKMLATTLMRQQLRCMQNMVGKKPLLIGNGTLVPKPRQFLATSAVNRSSGDHVRMWTMERGVSVLQIPALIVPFIHTTFWTDAMSCTLAVLHSHWGKTCCPILHKRKAALSGSRIRTLQKGLSFLKSA